MNRFSIQSKFTFLLLLVALFVISMIGILTWHSSRTTLNQAVFNQLTGVRAAKARELEAYFAVIRSTTAFLAEDHMIVSAMLRLNQGYQALSQATVTAEMDQRLTAYYTDTFIPRLQKNLADGAPDYRYFLPQSPAARYLQYHYIVANQNAVGSKQLLDDAGDGSTYSQFHQQYQPRLRDLVLRFDYYDFFLIDIDTGDVIFSVAKESDFAVNLLTGPYHQSGLADIVHAVQEAPMRQKVEFVDFQPYLPSYNAPAGFSAAAIYDGPNPIGILAIQFPVDEINRIVTGNQSWQAEGLGASGETYLIGPDKLMRSNARLLLEDKVNYLTTLRQLGTPMKQVQLIEQLQTTLLLQEINTEATALALKGETDTRLIDDYRGMPVLSSFAPVNIPGLRWAILTEMDAAEAFAPLALFQKKIFTVGFILLFAVILVAQGASYLLTIPLYRLAAYMQQVRRGEFDGELDTEARDEFGHLARSLDALMQEYQQLTHSLESRSMENHALLHTLLPPAVVTRLQRGEEQVVDTIQQTSIVHATIVGFTPLLRQQGEAAVSKTMNEIIQAFDEAARRHELERQRTVGDSYVAVCGLDVLRLDHDKRAVHFALELFHLVRQINEAHELNLGVRVGVHSGTVVAGVLGGNKFMYNLWGAPLKVATTLAALAERNTLLITDEVYKRLDTTQGFVRRNSVQVDEVGELLTWARLEQGKLAQRQIDLVQGSFAKCLPISEEVAEKFYARLFELAPSARALFPEKMQEQQRKLMNTLNVAVGALNAPEKIIPVLHNLGRKHVGYGATDDAYQVVGEALIWTLQARLGDEFTLETKEAWLATYGWLSQIMIGATHEAAADSSTVPEESKSAALPLIPKQQMAAAQQATKRKS